MVGVREETTARMERERRAEEAIAEQRRELARKHEEALRKRREAAEEKKRRLIRGRPITEKPIPIKDLTSDSGEVVIAGRRLDYEEKEISGGDCLLVSFNVSDYTNTIKCKMFLAAIVQSPRRMIPRSRCPLSDEQRAYVARYRQAPARVRRRDGQGRLPLRYICPRDHADGQFAGEIRYSQARG